ncbi:HD domain-containing protein [Azospirillum sp. B4]|uniref:primase 1D-like protein n=1 Tax=Azospirillum sp. B4 TaxID=95605 RepID=UPI00034582DA|nr:HD domain-containing protein [Azospirillum sp. B4]
MRDGGDVDSLAVARHIVTSLGLQDHRFHLVRHAAAINWRQRNPDAAAKLDDIATGIRFDSHDLLPLSGEALGRLRPADWVTPTTPLLSLTSRVIDPAGNTLHLPLMNLHLDEPVSLGALRRGLEQLVDGPFFLMRTDRYYHVYGSRLLSEDEWRTWNLNFLMVDAIVSPRYIGHSLQRGFNLLRLNATTAVKTTVPHLMTEREETGDGSAMDRVRTYAVARHARQLTRGGEPYCLHLFEVEAAADAIAADLDLPEATRDQIRQAAILHDVIEDTGAEYEDVAGVAGPAVADLVAMLSNDKRRPKGVRDAAFLAQIAAAPLPAQVIKLADLLANLSAIDRQRQAGGALNHAYLAKAERFLAVLDPRLRATAAFPACHRTLASLHGEP